jgi:hypothetical protein
MVPFLDSGISSIFRVSDIRMALCATSTTRPAFSKTLYYGILWAGSHSRCRGLDMGKAPCNCARAALVLSATLLSKRTECIRLVDEALESAEAEEHVASLLAKVAATAAAAKQAAERAEKEALAAAAKAETEAAKAAKIAEADAAKATREAAVALAKARKEEDTEMAKAAKVEAAATQAKVKAEQAVLAEEARAAARVEQEEAKARAAEERRQYKEAAVQEKRASGVRTHATPRAMPLPLCCRAADGVGGSGARWARPTLQAPSQGGDCRAEADRKGGAHGRGQRARRCRRAGAPVP